MENEIKLDVIVICKNKPYPKKEDMWCFSNDNRNNISEDKVLEYMLYEIQEHFNEYDTIIVLKNNIVIDIINKEDKH